MDLNAGSIERAISGEINRVVINESKGTTKVFIHQNKVGMISYDLINKDVSWGQDRIKKRGCKYRTGVSRCINHLTTLKSYRTVIADFSDTYRCFFDHVNIVGKYMHILEEIETIIVNHPECTQLLAKVSDLNNDWGFCEYGRGCVPRWQKGTIDSVVVRTPTI